MTKFKYQVDITDTIKSMDLYAWCLKNLGPKYEKWAYYRYWDGSYRFYFTTESDKTLSLLLGQ